MEGTIGEIRMFAGNFAPRYWAYCDGALLPIAQNTAFFSVLGTTYGGNGTTTFGLPDLRSRTAVGVGSGPGLSAIVLGEMSGRENVSILAANMPAHSHALGADAKIAVTAAAGDETSPVNNYLAASSGTFKATAGASQYLGNTLSGNTATAGSSTPLAIRSPYLGVNYVICMSGIFPSRN
jgi:microcystin-dependent protein